MNKFIQEPQKLKVRVGEWDTQTSEEPLPHQDRSVYEVVIHENFYKGGLFNDVALLFLSEAVDMSYDNVGIICLPPQDSNFDYSRCSASGWGKDTFGRDGTYQVIMKKVDLPVVPRDHCQAALRETKVGRRFNLHESFICAGGEAGKDTCKGDGGSPLVCPIQGSKDRFYQAGIVAWGVECGAVGIPGVYVNVAKFRYWIDQHLMARNYETYSYQFS